MKHPYTSEQERADQKERKYNFTICSEASDMAITSIFLNSSATQQQQSLEILNNEIIRPPFIQRKLILAKRLRQDYSLGNGMSGVKRSTRNPDSREVDLSRERTRYRLHGFQKRMNGEGTERPPIFISNCRDSTTNIEINRLFKANPRHSRRLDAGVRKGPTLANAHEEDLSDHIFDMVETTTCPRNDIFAVGRSTTKKDALDVLCEGTENLLCQTASSSAELCPKIPTKSNLLEYNSQGTEEANDICSDSNGVQVNIDTRIEKDVLDFVCEKMETVVCGHGEKEDYDTIHRNHLSLKLNKSRRRSDRIFATSDTSVASNSALAPPKYNEKDSRILKIERLYDCPQHTRGF
jgi:hypothetical protein